MDISTSIRGDNQRFEHALDQWTAVHTKHHQQHMQQHTTLVQATTHDLDHLTQQHHDYQQQLQQQHSDAKVLQSNVQALNGELQQIQQALQGLPQKQQLHTTTYTTLQQQHGQLQHTYQQLVHQHQNELVVLVQGLQLYEQAFGLEFEFLTGERVGVMRIVFSKVHAQDMTRKYSVEICLNSAGDYEAQGSTPALQSLPHHVSQLNKHSRLDLFVMKVRQDFEQLARTER